MRIHTLAKVNLSLFTHLTHFTAYIARDMFLLIPAECYADSLRGSPAELTTCLMKRSARGSSSTYGNVTGLSSKVKNSVLRTRPAMGDTIRVL